MTVVGVVVSPEYAVDPADVVAEQLRAQIGRGVDQQPLAAVALDQDRDAGAAVLRLVRVALAPIGADPRHSGRCAGAEYDQLHAALAFVNNSKKLRVVFPASCLIGSLRKSASESLLGQKYDSTGRPRNVLRKCPPKSLSSSSAQLLTLMGDTPEAEEDAAVYWPLDLLPLSCPHTRIFTWGWKVDTVDGKLVFPQRSLGDHAEAMLAELSRARGASWAGQRPLVFVAHSTGGILVKEVHILITSPSYPVSKSFSYFACRRRTKTDRPRVSFSQQQQYCSWVVLIVEEHITVSPKQSRTWQELPWI